LGIWGEHAITYAAEVVLAINLLQSGNLKYVSWLFSSFYRGDNRDFMKERFKTHLMVPISPLHWKNDVCLQFTSIVYGISRSTNLRTDVLQ
jgi:hypothetical protein